MAGPLQKGVDSLLIAHGATLIGGTTALASLTSDIYRAPAQILIWMACVGFMLALLAQVGLAGTTSPDGKRRTSCAGPAEFLAIIAGAASALILLTVVYQIGSRLGINPLWS